jgi:hypothetical protein
VKDKLKEEGKIDKTITPEMINDMSRKDVVDLDKELRDGLAQILNEVYPAAR